MPKTDRTKRPKCKHCGRTLTQTLHGVWVHKHRGTAECPTPRKTKAEPKWEEPTAHEETRARQTGASVAQLRREQKQAQAQALLEQIRKLQAEFVELVGEPNNEDRMATYEQVRDLGWDDGLSDFMVAEDKFESESYMKDEDEACGCCGTSVDMSMSGAKPLGCGECDKVFCSGECYDKHVQKSGHDGPIMDPERDGPGGMYGKGSGE